MSDGLPTGEQLARIEQAVRARIRRRAAVRQGVLGGAVAVVLLGGGIAVLPHVAGSTASSGSAAGSGAGGSAAAVVECHASTAAGSAVRTERVTGRLPAAAFAACGDAAVEFQSGSGALPNDQSSRGAAASSAAPAPSAPPRTGTLCRAQDGTLHVYPTADARVCVRRGLRPF